MPSFIPVTVTTVPRRRAPPSRAATFHLVLRLAAISLSLACLGPPALSQLQPPVCSHVVEGTRCRAGNHRRRPDGRNSYSRRSERIFGGTLAHEIESSSRLINDSTLNEYLRHVNLALARVSGIELPLRIAVLDDARVNAYSVPENVYLTRGVLFAVENEAELAGVISHEQGHLAAHDSWQSLVRLRRRLPLRRFKRSSEFEADRLAILYLGAAGYDPDAFAGFLQRAWSRPSAGRCSVVMRALEIDPPPEERVWRIRETERTLLPRRTQYLLDTSEFDKMKEHLLTRFRRELFCEQDARVSSTDTSAKKQR